MSGNNETKNVPVVAIVDNFQEKLNVISQKFASIAGALGKEKIVENLASIDAELMNENVYTDLEKSKALLKSKARLEFSLSKITNVEKAIDDFAVAIDFVKNGETDMLAELDGISKNAEKLTNELYLETLYSDEYDNEDVLLEIHACVAVKNPIKQTIKQYMRLMKALWLHQLPDCILHQRYLNV